MMNITRLVKYDLCVVMT